MVVLLYYFTCFRLSLFSDINVSQGSVATLVRCVGIFNANFIANFLTSQALKELWKSANIWRSYRKNKKVRVFFETQCSSTTNHVTSAATVGSWQMLRTVRPNRIVKMKVQNTHFIEAEYWQFATYGTES